MQEAAKAFLTQSAARGLERGTLAQYRQLADLHIVPLIGPLKLTALTVAQVRHFEGELRETGRSPAMVKKILVALGSILADAQENGLVGQNVARGMQAKRGRGIERRQEKRHRGRLKIGVDIPTPGEVKALVAVLQGRWRPLLLTAIFTGLRASELRGLRWSDVDLDARAIHVRQRADRFHDIGPPKSEAGEREVPIPPIVVNTLREWRLSCPRGDLLLVFPNQSGKAEAIGNIVKRGLQSAWISAGVTVTVTGLTGSPEIKPKYTGLH